VHESAGKLAMGAAAGLGAREWAVARDEFLQAFKAFSEAGLAARITANLQYLLVANMLSGSRISPFSDQSAKAYEGAPAIAPFAALTAAYLNEDVGAFMRVAAKHEAVLTADAFVATFVHDLKAAVRASAALLLVTPYTRVKYSHVAAELGVSVAEAEAILVSLLVDGRLPPDASLDQPRAMLVLSGTASGAGAERSPPVKAADERAAAAETTAAAAAAAVRRRAAVYGELDKLAGKLRGLVAAVKDARVASAAADGGGRGGRRSRHSRMDDM